MAHGYLVLLILFFSSNVLPQNKLSIGFTKPAQRAVKTIAEDTLTTAKNQEKSPTFDRISEANQAATSPADKRFAEALREFYQRKVVHNVTISAVRLLAEMEAEELSCRPLECKEVRAKFVTDYLKQDRSVAKMLIAEEECAEALSTSLKEQIFAGMPPACGK
jgi:hypothetical protein